MINLLAKALFIICFSMQTALAMYEVGGKISENTNPLRFASYDGIWAGVIKCLYDPGLWPEDECDTELKLEVSGKNIGVQQIIHSKKDGKVTSDAGVNKKFTFTTLGPSAVAVSMDSGDDADGTWVETWSFVMTLKDSNHMIVHWTRVVNNIDIPTTENISKFSSVGMGVLERK